MATLNQIEYWKLQETKRQNQASLQETRRSNLANEAIQRNFTQGRLAVDREYNLGNLDIQSKRQQEDKRHNLTSEYYSGVSARQQTRSLDLQERNTAAREQEVETGRFNAETNRINAATNQYMATTGRQQVQLGYSQLAETTAHNRMTEGYAAGQNILRQQEIAIQERQADVAAQNATTAQTQKNINLMGALAAGGAFLIKMIK